MGLDSQAAKKKPVTKPDTANITALEEDINLLKKENSQLICDVEEAKRQNEALQEKIEMLMAQAAAAKKVKKKKNTKKRK
jgi:predicted RNase H-like nuclease (RuvC/YqgF family)